MAKEKYSWENLIFNPTTDEAKNAVGKEVYYSDAPLNCIDYADKDNTEFLGVLDSAIQSNAPFYIRGIGYWNCIIVKKEEPYSERAKKWIKENDLKVNDYVKVTRKAEIYEDGWDSLWNDSMTDYIGKALKVLAINSLRGLISLDCDDTVYDFPYFVLEKTEPPKPKYVQFQDGREFFNSYLSVESRLEKEDYFLSNHGIWLKAKDADDALFIVTEIWSYGVCVSGNMKTTNESEDFYLTINDATTWEQLLKRYTFLNGSPCGKLMEVKDL